MARVKARGKAKPRKTTRRVKVSAKGKKHPHKGHRVSAATRRKIAASMRGKKHPHKGHPLSAATRAKISAGVKAANKRKTTLAGKKKVKRKATAKQLAALARARAKQKGKPRTAAQKAALKKASAMSKGKKRTPKQLQALAAGRQRGAQLRLADKLLAHNRALTAAQAQLIARRAAGKLAGTAHVRPSTAAPANYVASPDFGSYRAQLTARVAGR